MLKVLKFDKKNSLKSLKIFLDKRKTIQKNQTSIVTKIIKNVKKNGDKAVIKEKDTFSSFDVVSEILPPMTLKRKSKLFDDELETYETSNHVIEIKKR